MFVFLDCVGDKMFTDACYYDGWDHDLCNKITDGFNFGYLNGLMR